MNLFQKLAIVIALAALPLLLGFASSNVNADVTLNAVGDLGCKSASISNLKNLDASPHTLLGLGDYLYKCSPSSVQKYYDGIVKIGAKGNHDTESNSKTWAKNNFKYGDRGYGSWKLGDIGIIILDPYQSYKSGSAQYNYVKAKLDQFDNRIDINWIVVAVHEPLWTPSVSGGHGPNTGLRSTYGPLLDPINNLILLEAHNHVTALGTVAGINQALCGGGGYGGDTIGALNGFTWGTSSQFGYCKFQFEPNKITAQLIGTDGAVKKTHTFTK